MRRRSAKLAARRGPIRGRALPSLSKYYIIGIFGASPEQDACTKFAAKADKTNERRAIRESPLRMPSAVWGMAVRAAFKALLK